MEVDVSNKKRFEWVWEGVQKKLKQWEFVLLPFKIKVKIISAYIILLILFPFPILKTAKTNWKEFLKPNKSFLWKMITSTKRPWQWWN